MLLSLTSDGEREEREPSSGAASFADVLVPEGHLTIAQGFNLGENARRPESPEGTAEFEQWVSRPSRTYLFPISSPRLKPWAIVGCPSGTEGCIRDIRSNPSGRRRAHFAEESPMRLRAVLALRLRP